MAGQPHDQHVTGSSSKTQHSRAEQDCVCVGAVPPAEEWGPSTANSFRFLQKKYQERLDDLEAVEEEFANFKETHSKCALLKKDSKRMSIPMKKKAYFF